MDAAELLGGAAEPERDARISLLLHARLRAAFRQHDGLLVHPGEGRLEDHGQGWTRPPGGIDIVVERQASGSRLALGAKVKIRELDELLWDAVQIAQRVGDQGGPKRWALALGPQAPSSDADGALLVVVLRPRS